MRYCPADASCVARSRAAALVLGLALVACGCVDVEGDLAADGSLSLRYTYTPPRHATFKSERARLTSPHVRVEDLQRDQVRFQEILGIGSKDDGMPLPEDGAPPAALAGKDLAFYDDLLTRAREHLKRVAVSVKDSDLTIIRPRTRPNGEPRELEVRWMIHFMVGHFAGHFGQILLLQHARQAMKAEAKRS